MHQRSRENVTAALFLVIVATNIWTSLRKLLSALTQHRTRLSTCLVVVSFEVKTGYSWPTETFISKQICKFLNPEGITVCWSLLAPICVPYKTYPMSRLFCFSGGLVSNFSDVIPAPFTWESRIILFYLAQDIITWRIIQGPREIRKKESEVKIPVK